MTDGSVRRDWRTASRPPAVSMRVGRACALTVDAAAVAQARLVLPPDVMDMIELDHRLRAGVLKAVGVDRVVVPTERELVVSDPRAERGRR